jgi:hypothetical protein
MATLSLVRWLAAAVYGDPFLRDPEGAARCDRWISDPQSARQYYGVVIQDTETFIIDWSATPGTSESAQTLEKQEK